MKQFAIIPLLLLCLLSGGFRGLGNTTACSFAMPSPGAVAANSLAPSCLSNPADTVTSNTSWTTAPASYIVANNVNNYVFKSLSTYRDVEVSLWAVRGYTYLRLDGTGKAIYFRVDATQTNGYLEIGIVTGLTESSYASGTYYPLYENNNLNGTIGTSGTLCSCGYTKATATDGQYWTFGVRGFDIYVKYNGTQFATFKEYRQMNYGAVAAREDAFKFRGDNTNHIPITPLYAPALYSRYSIGELDMRDFGLRSISTTGTISASSNSLVVAAKKNFQIGDWVIVEIGHEAGAGARGTVGVGGVWPALSYANATAMNADHGQAVNTFARLLDTGETYQFVGGVWGILTSQYYLAKALPSSLHGRITAISGDGLTLTLVDQNGSAANAAVTATNANVYLDNQPYVNYLTGRQDSSPGFLANLTPITPTNETIIFPSGSYAASGRMIIGAQSGWTIKGQGQTHTTLFAPKGVYSANFSTLSIYSGYTFQDFTLTGNWGLDKYGLGSAGWTYIPGGLTAAGLMPSNPNTDDSTNWLSQTNAPGTMYTGGITINSSHNSVIQDITINEVSQLAVGTSFANNVWAYRVTNNQTSPQQIYVQWQFLWANGTGGGCVDCTVNSTYMIAGFESFAHAGHQFIRPVATNAVMAENTSQGWLIQDASLTISALAGDFAAWSVNNPIINIDANIGGSPVASGGTISNATMVQQGYNNAANDVLTGIIVNPNLPNITITGGSYTAPNYAAPSALFGPVAIDSTGPSTAVTGFTARGTIAAGTPTTARSNIGVLAGSVINSCADTTIVIAGVSIPTGTSGNTIPCP